MTKEFVLRRLDVAIEKNNTAEDNYDMLDTLLTNQREELHRQVYYGWDIDDQHRKIQVTAKLHAAALKEVIATCRLVANCLTALEQFTV